VRYENFKTNAQARIFLVAAEKAAPIAQKLRILGRPSLSLPRSGCNDANREQGLSMVFRLFACPALRPDAIPSGINGVSHRGKSDWRAVARL